MNDGDEDVRRAAVYALGTIGQPTDTIIPTLIETLNDESLRVRVAIIWNLGEISEFEEIGEQIDDVVPVLIEALRDENPPVRYGAALALGRIGEPAHDAVPALIEALDDESDRVYNQVSETLQRIGTPEALAAVNGHKR